jgi:hypothetical protein
MLGVNVLVAPSVIVFTLRIVALTCARSLDWREVLLDGESLYRPKILNLSLKLWSMRMLLVSSELGAL